MPAREHSRAATSAFARARGAAKLSRCAVKRRVVRAEQLGGHLRRPADPEDLSPVGTGDQPRLRDRQVPSPRRPSSTASPRTAGSLIYQAGSGEPMMLGHLAGARPEPGDRLGPRAGGTSKGVLPKPHDRPGEGPAWWREACPLGRSPIRSGGQRTTMSATSSAPTSTTPRSWVAGPPRCTWPSLRDQTSPAFRPRTPAPRPTSPAWGGDPPPGPESEPATPRIGSEQTPRRRRRRCSTVPWAEGITLLGQVDACWEFTRSR